MIIRKIFQYTIISTSMFLIAASNILWLNTVKATDNVTSENYTVVTKSTTQTFTAVVNNLYSEFGAETCMPKIDVFEKALKGYYQLKNNGQLLKDNILTVIDFRLSSNEKRLWVFDLADKKVLFHTWVAHGRNSGEEYATTFSNKIESFQSSLGFYVTGETYEGKHGLSLMLDGQEKGFNTNARERAVVMHGADYVSEQFMAEHGRLGRSYGCPAISRALQQEIIPLIADKSCLFIYYPDKKYEFQSALLNAEINTSQDIFACIE